MTTLPILYSFRRCPYAIRARLALAAAGLRPGRDLELREVDLQRKPPELLETSPKGTVPVLALPEGSGAPGRVLDQSLAVMRWALERRDDQDLLRQRGGSAVAGESSAMEVLIAENDGPFKLHLDRFKYSPPAGKGGWERGNGDWVAPRAAALAVLRRWSARLAPGGWLLGDCPCLADWALLPFVRQFRQVSPETFDTEPDLEPLQGWLRRFLEGPELQEMLDSTWGPRRRWRSGRWLYHLALAGEWRAATASGQAYARSSRGLALADVGFVHASGAGQIEGTYRRFYADAQEVLLLTIDPARLTVPVRWEPAPQGGDCFPHIFGAVPLEAVLAAEPFRPEGGDERC